MRRRQACSAEPAADLPGATRTVAVSARSVDQPDRSPPSPADPDAAVGDRIEPLGDWQRERGRRRAADDRRGECRGVHEEHRPKLGAVDPPNGSRSRWSAASALRTRAPPASEFSTATVDRPVDNPGMMPCRPRRYALSTQVDQFLTSIGPADRRAPLPTTRAAIAQAREYDAAQSTIALPPTERSPQRAMRRRIASARRAAEPAA